MHRLVAALALLILPALACSSDDQGPEFTDAPFTLEDLPGTVLGFVPSEPVGGIDRWEYKFTGSGAIGCNIERSYQATSWELIDDRTVRVHFGGQWEQYRLVNYTGRVANGDLAGTFEYTSSPGVSMTGQLFQQSSTIFC
ncbi:MAG: hypothetical protein ACE5GJ_06775 [Gemmatimonadota bacterium]